VAQLEDEFKWADNRRRNAENETEAERRSKAAYKGQLTKVRRKVANGSCPCCNRHFENLQRHMQTKHPEYVAESNEEARKDEQFSESNSQVIGDRYERESQRD
jgi:hypothetical protein